MEYSEEDEIPKTPLFEKPLTPSDVGKLNRLVIPKQHAENCFPMNAGGGGGGDPKGCYLSFEDEARKPWRFRYSYWNSSQSYVLTKGWSRFVKESRLAAGDIVVFSRHSEDAGRFFIGWRRRRSSGCAGESGGGWIQAAHPPLSRLQAASSLSYQSGSPHAAATAGSDTLTQNHQRKATSGNSKKLRLFGVNLEYWDAEEEEEIMLTPPMGQTPYPTITPTTWT